MLISQCLWLLQSLACGHITPGSLGTHTVLLASACHTPSNSSFVGIVLDTHTVQDNLPKTMSLIQSHVPDPSQINNDGSWALGCRQLLGSHLSAYLNSRSITSHLNCRPTFLTTHQTAKVRERGALHLPQATPSGQSRAIHNSVTVTQEDQSRSPHTLPGDPGIGHACCIFALLFQSLCVAGTVCRLRCVLRVPCGIISWLGHIWGKHLSP